MSEGSTGVERMREQLDARTEALRKAEALLEQFQHRMPDVELADVLDSAEPPVPTTPSKGACVEVDGMDDPTPTRQAASPAPVPVEPSEAIATEAAAPAATIARDAEATLVRADRAARAVGVGVAVVRPEAVARWRAEEEGEGHLKPEVSRREEEASREREPVEIGVTRVKDVAPRGILRARLAE